jgi:hypothetical protein
MKVEVLNVDSAELARLDQLILDGAGRILPLSASFYHDLCSVDLIRAWCGHRARYGIVTQELLDWLTNEINGRKALEIGAGMGDLGSHLGIPMTDSYQQVDNPETALFMQFARQTPTKPPPTVVKCDAQTAVKVYRPQVVVASWITQRWLPYDTEGNVHGPREEQIIENCETYIFIGNEAVHGRKRILALRHQTFKFPWLISRAADQSKNVIWVWNK